MTITERERYSRFNCTNRHKPEPTDWYGVLATSMIGLLLVAALLALLASSGCVPAIAIEQAATEAAISAGDARDEDYPREAREVGTTNYDAWESQYEALTGGDPLPEESRLAAEDRVE
jgi:hypothetical protein